MRDRGIITIAAIICVGVLACSATIILFNNLPVEDDSIPEYFGLSSTKLTLSTNDADPYQLGTWSLPSGKSYSDIEWSSSDSSVATVDGGKIKGVSTGQATITARLGSYSDTCLVTVDSSTGDRPTYFYNAYSEKFDFAELTGDAFEGGYLSVAFNANKAMVITLAGYAPLWLTQNSSFTGNATADFTKIEMALNDGTEDIATGTYENQYKKYSYPWDLGKQTTVTDSIDTTMLTVDTSKLTYKEYTVTFTLTSESHVYVLTGTISYQEGDGRFDTSGTYTRTYAWNYGLTKYTCQTYGMTLEYPYSDYWNGYYKNTKLLDTDTLRNYKAYSWVTEFTTSSTTIKTLADSLKAEYTEYSENNDEFAEFVLAFGQISYEYGYDYAQYIKGTGENSESTDYWAYGDQTVFSGIGDCEDTSILLASVLKALNYSTACVVLPSHMTFAVALDEYTLMSKAYTFEVEESKYYLCETTVHGPAIKDVSTMFTTKYRWVSYLSPNVSASYPVGIISSDYEGEEFSYYLL